MKLHRSVKIIFIILLVMLAAAAFFVAANYGELRQAPAQGAVQNYSSQPQGTCAPDLANCNGNPELCMTENKAAVCD